MAMKNKVILFGYYFSIFAVSTTTASYSAGEIRECEPSNTFCFRFCDRSAAIRGIISMDPLRLRVLSDNHRLTLR